MQGAQTDFAAEIDDGDDGDVSVSCPEGGTVRVSGTASQDGLDFTMTLEGCRSQGVVIDGELSLVGEATASGSRFQYIGELTFSGAVDMACAVDLSTKTSTSIDGMTVSAEAEVSGSICGYDASVAVST